MSSARSIYPAASGTQRSSARPPHRSSRPARHQQTACLPVPSSRCAHKPQRAATSAQLTVAGHSALAAGRRWRHRIATIHLNVARSLRAVALRLSFSRTSDSRFGSIHLLAAEVDLGQLGLGHQRPLSRLVSAAILEATALHPLRCLRKIEFSQRNLIAEDIATAAENCSSWRAAAAPLMLRIASQVKASLQSQSD